jgi:cytochrome c553
MVRIPTRRAAGAVLLLLGVLACNQTPTPGLSRGEALFDTCVPCHGADGGGNETLAAPTIAGLPQWYVEAQLRKFQAGHRGGTAFDTTGIRMKAMSWSLDLEGDLESVAEYVASLSSVTPEVTVQGNAQAGQAAFQTCVACHGPAAQGMEPLGAPPLVGQSDWYMLAQLRKFKSGMRGADPEDVSGGTMRPNALLLDDQAMLDVVAYIQTLR